MPSNYAARFHLSREFDQVLPLPGCELNQQLLHSAVAGARIPGQPISVQRRVVAAIKQALANAR